MKISIRMPLLFGRQAQNIEGKARQAVSGTSLSTRLGLAMVSLVVVTTAVLSLFTYHSVTEAGIPRALDRLATKAMLGATKLETALNVARQDVMVVQGAPVVTQMGVARAANPFEPVSDKPLETALLRGFWQRWWRSRIMPSWASSASLMAGANCCASTAGGPAAHPASFPRPSLFRPASATISGARSASQSPTFTYRPLHLKKLAVATVLRRRRCMSRYLC